jgi:hypothetical protein
VVAVPPVHLSTCIVMMFVAGAMEFSFFRYCMFLEQQSPDYWRDWHPLLVCLVVIFGPLPVLLVVGFLLEWRIRRRERP